MAIDLPYNAPHSDWSRCSPREIRLLLGRLRSLITAMTPIHGVGPVSLDMKSKTCSKCGETLPFSCFYGDKRASDKKGSRCKGCISEYAKGHYARNKEKINARNKEYYARNSVSIIAKQKEKYEENPDKRLDAQAAYREANRDKIRVRQREHYWANRERRLAMAKVRRDSRKEERNLKTRQRRKSDPQYHIGMLLRERLNNCIRGLAKSGSAVRDLGCSVEKLMDHLESLFAEGMSWNNRGEWHIDHIKPLSSFDLTDREQLLEACHYTNLQPLWAKDNLSKGNKVNQT